LARTAFMQAGGFDPQFKRAEDIELGFRLWEHGVRFVFEPQAEVLHYATRSFESWCRTPYQYGRYDVVMQRDKGHEVLEDAAREFRERHVLNQLLVWLCLGRRKVTRVAVLGLGYAAQVADRLGAHRPAVLALSGLFNLLYWQGVSDELGGPQRLWRSITAYAAAS
jgi:GT2 family glycosyltransferase